MDENQKPNAVNAIDPKSTDQLQNHSQKQNHGQQAVKIFLVVIIFIAILFISYVNLSFIKKNDSSRKDKVSEHTQLPKINTTPSIPVTYRPVATTSALVVTHATELPKLYPGLRWKTTQRQKFTAFSRNPGKPTLPNVIQLDGYSTQSEDIDHYPGDFVDYYTQALTTAGWHMTMSTSGDSSGRFRDISGYELNGRYITITILGQPSGGSLYTAIVEHN